ncbi:CRISPR-associated endonuclease Cas1 [Prolixibacteraceae bacterium JC049]|nr:CRISPR-associated endonuclease Cas1 [Prolixibacteraceae bacterium JC049]
MLDMNSLVKTITMQIVLDTYGINLSVRNKCFLLKKGRIKRMIHPSRVSSFLVTMPCNITSPAIILAASNEIAITVCSNTGSPDAKLWSSHFINTPALRRKQYLFNDCSAACEWSKKMIRLKLKGQSANLALIANRKEAIKERSLEAISLIEQQIRNTEKVSSSTTNWTKTLRYLEASSANQYWQTIGIKLPAPYYFEHRIKQKPPDAFNSSVNYLYGILRNHIETAILSLGLDPALGVMHVDGYNRPSLVFDLMEPFRPIMDKLLLENILAGKLANSSVVDSDGVCWLNRKGRKKLIDLFNKKLHQPMVYNKQKTNLNNHVLTETKLLTHAIKRNGN